jgi:hypothetical protein
MSLKMRMRGCYPTKNSLQVDDRFTFTFTIHRITTTVKPILISPTKSSGPNYV